MTTGALGEVVDLLACPHCRQPMHLDDRVLGCTGPHRFDLAKQGYVNLLGGRAPRNADTAEMVAARERFLGAGHYLPLRDALATLIPSGTVLDAGSGPGWYAAGLTEKARGLALDVSAAAARRAAGAHPHIGALVADTWGPLPVADGMINTVLTVFAPRNHAEFARVLSPGGRLLVVTPAVDHLAEATDALGLIGMDPEKEDRLHAGAAEHFTAVSRDTVRCTMQLTVGELADLVGMGPNAFHRGDPEPIAVPERITASFVITRFMTH
ncbi:MAG: hypothetical protein L0G99_13740 [Propionibacteriales bacterium]|nr:hypothetical protein [Propionibacteriales bacterium]